MAEIKSSVRPHVNLFNHSVDLFSNYMGLCLHFFIVGFAVIQNLAQATNKNFIIRFLLFQPSFDFQRNLFKIRRF